MDLSIFDVLGPVMIGPSSSHTAGAAKLAHVAAVIAAKPFEKVSFGLSGSFAETGQGHGTNKALLAGALGFAPDDERIRDVEQYAAQMNVQAEFHREDLDWMHENSVHITFYHENGIKNEVWGSSIGGGRVEICRIGNMKVSISAESPTLIVRHLDRAGVVGEIGRVLAESNLNIAVMRLTREQRGHEAIAILEVDGIITEETIEKMAAKRHVLEVTAIDVS